MVNPTTKIVSVLCTGPHVGSRQPADGVNVCSARPFVHAGPGQSRNAASSRCSTRSLTRYDVTSCE
jgi:hypothetical protein